MSAQAIEHGSTKGGRWLRERRIRIVLAIAAVEGLLYIFGVLHWWAAFLLAIIALSFWWFVTRRSRSHALRQIGWIFATSQLLVLCVPLAIGILTAVGIALIILFAIGALIFLFTERS